MIEYNKIETLYEREPKTKKLNEGVFRNPTVEYLKDLEWVWTEKIDGTNIRVCWDGHNMTFGGRTDKAQIPAPLVNKLNEYFGGESSAQVFEQTFGNREVILFGEGYGAKIQDGGNYISDHVDFILFDIMINGNYQSRETVVGIANDFGLKVVPIIGTGTLLEAVLYVKKRPRSFIAQNPNYPMEGLVCRPAMELQDHCGNRIIVKIKWRDFE